MKAGRQLKYFWLGWGSFFAGAAEELEAQYMNCGLDSDLDAQTKDSTRRGIKTLRTDKDEQPTLSSPKERPRCLLEAAQEIGKAPRQDGRAYGMCENRILCLGSQINLSLLSRNSAFDSGPNAKADGIVRFLPSLRCGGLI
ncbi:uncharacterized protein B0H64DRAFT_371362 [Chaetomium fimeti]|uniref:Uncharacterized protein n=1 Tax=Chaetomium fimeti TaxID=1854472 RepID=A0AAE0HMJ3_9PEZI|nr:hypothetical protein B0H64DRAFT_371362 [Chaetomium fimeti]